jgi:hypothetical protein
VTLIDCRFDHNRADEFGGGACFLHSTPALFACDFDFFNTTVIAGGGAYVEGGTAFFRNCRFFRNFTSDGNGGGLALVSTSNVTIVDCTFEENGADLDHDGGGLHSQSSSATITRGTFLKNNACKGGGAAASSGQLAFSECTFSGNQALPSPSGVTSGVGAGLYRDNAISGVTATRCLFVANEARGEMFNEASGAGAYGCALERCTLASNQLTGFIGGFAEGSGAAACSLHNCIVWLNTPVLLSLSPGTTATYSDVEASWPGTGNISANPSFCSVPTGNYRLLAGSPCIDAGDPASSLDPDGSRADMGAYAFDHNAPTSPTTYCTAKVNSLGCTPSIVFIGSPSASSGVPFLIRALQVINNKSGLFFYGAQPAATAFQGGTLCVKTPIVRTTAQISGGSPPPNNCSGTFSLDFNAYIASGANPSLAPRVSVYGQYWYRDPSAVAGTGLTNAIAFTINP